MLEREAEGTPSASLAPRVALGGRGAGTRHCSAPFMQGGGPLAPGGQGRGGSLRLASERGVGSWAKAPAFPEGPGQWQAGHGAHAQECGTLHLCPSVRPVAPETGQLGTTALHRNIERCGTERGGPDPAAAASPVASPAASRTTRGGVRWQRRLVGRLVLVGRSPVPRAAKACPRHGGPGTPQLQGGRDRAGPQVVLGLVSPRGRMTAFQWQDLATRHGVRVAGGPARPGMRAPPSPRRDAHGGASVLWTGRLDLGLTAFGRGGSLASTNYEKHRDVLGPHVLGSPMCSLWWEPGLPQPPPRPSGSRFQAPITASPIQEKAPADSRPAPEGHSNARRGGAMRTGGRVEWKGSAAWAGGCPSTCEVFSEGTRFPRVHFMKKFVIGGKSRVNKITVS